jgi:nitrate reductase gamma subunit
MSDAFLFGVLPYLSLVLFFVVTIQRYRQQKFSYSSLSSQFLENRRHFWGTVPFHYGLLAVLAGHVVAFLVPNVVLAWNAVPLRLWALEATGLALGLLTFVGLVTVVVRRVADPRVRRTTTAGDWTVYALLLVQVVTGVGIAYHHGWGSSWFATSATPWLRSLLLLQPDLSYVTPLPWLAKAHIVNAFLLIGFFPFTRLVHVLVVPNMYLWRRTQIVLWNRPRGRPGAEA